MYRTHKVCMLLASSTRKCFINEVSKISATNFERGKRYEVRGITTIEGFQGKERSITLKDAQIALEEAVEYSIHGPSVQGIQGGHDEYAGLSDTNNSDIEEIGLEAPENVSALHCGGSINLHGCMQSNVPNPYSSIPAQNRNETTGTTLEHDDPKNMPGNSKKLLQKYISAGQNDVRTFHTSSSVFAQAAEVFENDKDRAGEDMFPQGIQGDDCVQYKLWLENCRKYGLPNCDEQLQSLESGRKTLAEIFAEQEELIKSVAKYYRNTVAKSQNLEGNLKADVQGIQMAEYTNIPDIMTPCPQGIQGDDCVSFKLWLENCHRFNMQDCQEHLQGIQTGRKTLEEVFREQDRIIRAAVSHYQKSKRHYSTSSSERNTPENEVGKAPSESILPESGDPSNSLPPQNPDISDQSQLTQRQRLKKAVKEYGSTVIVFHVGISLMSLGGFYMLISSGVDAVGLLINAGIGEEFFKSKLAAGASNFVVAYAVHKIFAPVRIGITLTATPLIVKYLRQKGILKPIKKNS